MFTYLLKLLFLATNDLNTEQLVSWYGQQAPRQPQPQPHPQHTFSVHAEPPPDIYAHPNVKDDTGNGSEEDAAYDEDGNDDSMSALPPAMRPTVGPIFDEQSATLGFRKIESPETQSVKNEQSAMQRRNNFPAFDESKYQSAEQAMTEALSQAVDQSDPRPFKCPNPECSKTWKNRNGLKYHLNHGNCNGVLKSLSREEAAVSERPYACPVPGCGKRWKNANGFRYHMDHSGAHGRSARRLHDQSGGFTGKSNLSASSSESPVKRPLPTSNNGSRRSSRRSTSKRIKYDDDEDGDGELEEEDDYGDDDDDDLEEEDDEDADGDFEKPEDEDEGNDEDGHNESFNEDNNEDKKVEGLLNINETDHNDNINNDNQTRINVLQQVPSSQQLPTPTQLQQLQQTQPNDEQRRLHEQLQAQLNAQSQPSQFSGQLSAQFPHQIPTNVIPQPHQIPQSISQPSQQQTPQQQPQFISQPPPHA